MENSHALGFGFRVGFLGLLHMEVMLGAPEQNSALTLSLPRQALNIMCQDQQRNGERAFAARYARPFEIDHIEEPASACATIMIPPDYVGAVMELTVAHRGTFKTMNYISPTTVEQIWEIPSSEHSLDYFDQLKSRTKGYASLGL